MNEPTNDDRAQWARDALAVFTTCTFGDDHPDTMDPGNLECAIGDLIADLMHYANRRGFDADGIVRHGRSHFEHELIEEELP